MATLAVNVANADRMMTHAEANDEGIDVVFADGARGVVPFLELPELGRLADLKEIELPNAYEILLRTFDGEETELPWDFVRSHCDPTYRPRIEALAAKGRQAMGQKIRRLREASGFTQEKLAEAAGVGRVTLIRIEKGEQSPKYDTLIALAQAMQRHPSELFLP